MAASICTSRRLKEKNPILHFGFWDPPPLTNQHDRFYINFSGAAVTQINCTTGLNDNDYLFWTFSFFHVLSGNFTVLTLSLTSLTIVRTLTTQKMATRDPPKSLHFLPPPAYPPILSIPDWWVWSLDSIAGQNM